jgi:hypothetical protein
MNPSEGVCAHVLVQVSGTVRRVERPGLAAGQVDLNRYRRGTVFDAGVAVAVDGVVAAPAFNRDCPLAEPARATQPSLPMISNGYH